jgi:hypothetical protein
LEDPSAVYHANQCYGRGVLVNYLTNLKDVMVEHKSDIKEFNTNVNTKLSSYYTNKHIQFDKQVLLEQLFEAYRYVADAEFQKYIMRKNDEHDKGTHIIMPKALMTFAYKKYHQTCKQKKVWGKKLREEQQIVYLMTQLKKKSNSKFNKSANKLKMPFSDKNSSNKGDKSFADKCKEGYDKAPGWMQKNPLEGLKSMMMEIWYPPVCTFGLDFQVQCFLGQSECTMRQNGRSIPNLHNQK